MNTLDEQYTNLLQDILDNGINKKDRTGTGTLSVFGRQIRHNMLDGFPLLTTKKMAWKTIVTELLWFLRGDTNIKYLLENDCHIWTGDAYKKYKQKLDKHYVGGGDIANQKEFEDLILTNNEFSKEWGELGPIYGKQWRSWGGRNILNYDLQNVKWPDKDKVMELIKNGEDYSQYDVNINYQNNSIDQIANLINELKTNPDSRRLMVSAWNVSELDQMVLPPCHYGFQVYTRELSLEERFRLAGNQWTPGGLPNQAIHFMNEKGIPTRAISLMYNARSQDVPLGTPFNLASYGLLLMILAKEVNMVPDELVTNMGDCHIYLNQIDGVKEQLTREPFELPTLSMDYREGEYDKELKGFVPDDFVLFNYQSHPSIKMPLSN